jgi:hypothetical protein
MKIIESHHPGTEVDKVNPVTAAVRHQEGIAGFMITEVPCPERLEARSYPGGIITGHLPEEIGLVFYQMIGVVLIE